MGETSYQIERHINEKRDDLGDNLDELEEKLRNAMDWRTQVQTRPGTMIALAFGGGVLLSAVLPGFSRRATGNGDAAGRPNETWAALKSALLAVAAAKLGGFIDGVLPGFSQEFTQARSGRTPQRNFEISISGPKESDRTRS
jgi:hypothetical protein